MAAHSQQFVVDEHGERKAVVLPIKEYDKMIADLHDLARLVERKDEFPIDLEEMQKRLKRHGLL